MNLVHVNLIPLNPTEGYAGRAAVRSSVSAFLAVWREAGIPGTVRVRRGIDIAAGCGQLRAQVAGGDANVKANEPPSIRLADHAHEGDAVTCRSS